MKALLVIPFLLVVALVAYNSGSFSTVTIWNMFPVWIGFCALQIGLVSSRTTAIGCISFAVSVTLIVALFHLAWLFDWGRTATGSSTSSLIFIFAPFWAVFFGGIIALVAWVIGRVKYMSA